MKLHILSDIHLEFGKWPKNMDIHAIDADVTILAGDIGVGLQGLEWALSIDRPVIYVMGNHEFYGQRPMTDLWRKAREKVEHTHVHLLENESVQIGNVRFLGCTLWTDFCINGPERQHYMMDHARQVMSDYTSIFVTQRGSRYGPNAAAGLWDVVVPTTTRAGDRLTPRKVLSLHHESRDYLEHELARFPRNVGESDEWDKTIVVTHHAPSALSLTYQKPASKSDAAYASALDALVEEADLWVHGHTHIPADYRIGSGRVVSNPRGYSGSALVTDFNPAFVVEV